MPFAISVFCKCRLPPPRGIALDHFQRFIEGGQRLHGLAHLMAQRQALGLSGIDRAVIGQRHRQPRNGVADSWLTAAKCANQRGSA